MTAVTDRGVGRTGMTSEPVESSRVAAAAAAAAGSEGSKRHIEIGLVRAFLMMK